MTRRRRGDVPAPAEPSRYVDLVQAIAHVSSSRDWLVEGAIEGTPVIVFSGPEKRGKSWINIDLAVSIASATPWLGCFPVPRPGTVVVVDGEYGPREWARRAMRICRGRGLDPRDVLPSIRYFDGQWGFLLSATNEDYIRLVRDVRESPPSLVIVDPLRNFFDGDENSAKDVLYAMRMLVGLRNAGECPVLAVHHLNKGGGVSGSRAIKTRADVFVDGTDAAEPTYLARGRSLRSGDAIARRFGVRIEHEHDDDDLAATTTLTVDWSLGPSSQRCGSDDKVLAAIRAVGSGLTINAVQSATRLNVPSVKESVARHLRAGAVRRESRTIRGAVRDVYVAERDWQDLVPRDGDDA